jgi:D-alanyl-D-alanine carboxypeptidase
MSERPAGCAGGGCVVAAPTPPTAVPTPSPAPTQEVLAASETKPPDLTAVSAAVIADDCDDLLYAKDAHQRLPPASITKIMTAIVALESSNPDDMVTVNIDGFFAGDSTVMGLETGMQLSLRDLLYGLLLPSGADSAVAIARYVAGDVPSFVERMNAKVRDLGLQDTHFTNPHGLDAAGHYSSAYDMVMIGRYAMKDPLIAEIVKTKQYTANWSGPELWNGNLLLWLYPGADGIKIGWTDNAGQTFVATAQRDGHRVYLALFNSQDRYTDAIRLFDWAFETLQSVPAGSCADVSANGS